jgi:hypothetical protein
MEGLMANQNRSVMPYDASKKSSRTKWITNRALMIFSAYRRDDFAEPELFLTQLGAVLEKYSDVIVNQVTNPYTGIQRQSKFPPTIAEVVDLCDYEVERADRLKRYAAMRPEPRPGRAPAESFANVFMASDHPEYAAWAEKARAPDADAREWQFGKSQDGKRDGLWIALGQLRPSWAALSSASKKILGLA